jgi:RHS repeat-associated protein
MNGCTGTAPTGTIQEYGYAYGAWGSTNNGNVTIMDGSGAQSFARTYTYDQLNRLSALSQSSGNTSLCSSVFGLSWTYDPWANRTAQNVTGGTCYSFLVTANAQNQLIDTMRNAYQYDSAGNMIADGSYTYFYDAENRLIQVAPPGTTSINCSNATACYVYDALGRRVRKSGLGVPLTTDFVYDLSGNVVGEFAPTCSGAECLTVGYAYLNGQLAAQYRGGTTYFVHKDHLGSTRLLTKLDQTVYDSLDYLPFGEQISGDTATTHKFTGKERDSESYLDNFGARYNSSNLGRFMSPDGFYKDSHVGDPQSWNLYAYARNNPLRYVDPTGENATVSTTCSTDANNHTTCNVNISASIAIYAAPGSGLTQEQLNGAASTIQSSIQNTWSGSFQQDGVTYNVSTQVSVQVAESEGAASKTGAQNVIGLSNGAANAAQGSQALSGPSNSLGTFFRGQDTGIWNYNTLGGASNDAAHEFSHLLGVGDHYDGDYVSNGHTANTPQHATGSDLRWGIKEATSGVNSWLNAPQYRPMRYGEVFEKPQTFSGLANVGAPSFGWWK